MSVNLWACHNTMSRFDQLYRSILISKFFTKGWGKPDNLKRLFEFRQIISNRETCQTLVPSDYPVHIDKEYVQGNIRIMEGHFRSPFTQHVPGVMPKEVETAKFQVILPTRWDTKLKPVCLHLAGTGDHYFWRRRTLIAKPLLKEYGIGSIILENPYYGTRKPKEQMRSSLHNVSDLFVMGGALVLESLALFHWCERYGLGPLAITGISMGGHMASATATAWHKPISLVPCLSWSTASCIFTKMASLAAVNWIRPVSLVPCLSWSTASVVYTQGVLRGSIPWSMLQSQYFGDRVYQEELHQLMHSPEDDIENAYNIGQRFVQSYSSNDHIDMILEEKEEVEKSSLRQSQPPQSVYMENASAGGNPQSQFYSSQHRENTAKSVVMGLARQFRRHPDTDTNSSQRGEKKYQSEAVDFMRGVMDEFTHLGNFSTPLDTSLIIIVAAQRDAYIPRDSVLSLEKIWPGAEVRYIDTGHVAAFLFKQDVFRRAIHDTLTRQIEKYYS